jgi:hypothetical protein
MRTTGEINPETSIKDKMGQILTIMALNILVVFL